MNGQKYVLWSMSHYRGCTLKGQTAYLHKIVNSREAAPGVDAVHMERCCCPAEYGYML
jgi:hypothetical protein